MIISREELREFDKVIDLFDRSDYPENGIPLRSHFEENPHLLFPVGFDEYIGLRKHDFETLDRRFGRAGWTTDTDSTYRTPTGSWYLLWDLPGFSHDYLSFSSERGSAEDGLINITLGNLRQKLKEICSDERPTSVEKLWSPALWTPKSQEEHRLALASTVTPIFSTFRSEGVRFQDLSWKQLEEVVAETLRRAGLDIHIVKERPQGGRDIVARGELIPGQEPLQIAIEVKHRTVVGRPELSTALWQNQSYPALMFVTSGRFTAGVLKEKASDKNRLRVFLMDGVALAT